MNPMLSKLYFIILTETWFNEVNADIYTVPGVNGVHNFRTRKKGGGVSIFVRNTIVVVQLYPKAKCYAQ